MYLTAEQAQRCESHIQRKGYRNCGRKWVSLQTAKRKAELGLDSHWVAVSRENQGGDTSLWLMKDRVQEGGQKYLFQQQR